MLTPSTERGQHDAAAKATIYEVAERAGVSIATVSHALNRPDRVAAATRLRVIQAADQLGFVGRNHNRARARAGTRRIGVIGPFSQHPSYFTRLAGVLRAAAGKIDVVVMDDSPGTGAPVIDEVPLMNGVDGLIIMGAEPSPRLGEWLAERGIATVLLDRKSDLYSSIAVDDEAGGRLVAEHLLSRGVRRPAWISPAPPPSRFVTSGELRLRGFTELIRHHTDGEVAWILADGAIEGGREAIRDLPADELPDAIFAVDDRLAAGVLLGLRERGLRVPEDVAVVGYDDSELAVLSGLTSVRQPFAASGRFAFEILQTLMAEMNRPVAHLALLPELVVRLTSSSPRDAESADVKGGVQNG